MIHKDEVENYQGSMEELAEEVGNLKYDALANFLALLSEKIEKDGAKDASRGRIQLAGNLQVCAEKLKEAQSSIDKAWIISEPYMK